MAMHCQKLFIFLLRDNVQNGINYVGTNWAFQIKSILESHGLGYVWHSQNLETVPFVFIKQRIIDNYYQRCYSEINNSPRLSSFCRFKHNFNQEQYLDVLPEKKYRIALCQFRILAHHLAVERSRYENIPRSERKCKVCNMNTTEKRVSFLLVCPVYKALRRKYFSSYFNHWPTLTKFDYLCPLNLRR